MKRLTLPVSSSDLAGMREDDCYYVDKRAHIYKLASKRGFYFLARPRRFGKSMIVSTLKYLFEGNEPLFRGLAIHKQWDWSQKHPVVRVYFTAGYQSTPKSIEEDLLCQFERIRRVATPDLSPPSSPTAKSWFKKNHP